MFSSSHKRQYFLGREVLEEITSEKGSAFDHIKIRRFKIYKTTSNLNINYKKSKNMKSKKLISINSCYK